MDNDKIIRLTNRIALLSILLMIYWTFMYISITVFDFKVFRENITEAFYLSILGVFALLSGSVFVNIMFNLTKISQSLGSDEKQPNTSNSKNKALIFLSTFPLIFLILYFGDMRSSTMKERHLIESAKFLLDENKKYVKYLANYSFSRQYILGVESRLKLMKKLDKNFPRVAVIVSDKIDGKEVYLGFRSYYFKEKELDKSDFIFSSSKEERIYLKEVFSGKNKDDLFSAHDGFYELYYPVHIDGKIIVLYFSDRERFGKYGS